MYISEYRVLLILIILFLSLKTRSQNTLSSYFEPSISLSYQVSSKYSHNFGIESRNSIYHNDKLVFKMKQIDISHLSEFQWNAQYAIGFGLQFRSEHTFDTTKKNEFRLQQELAYSPSSKNLQIHHRWRIEQRLYTSVSKHRFRYQLNYKIPLTPKQVYETYVTIETESLLELAKTQKPELEQRVGMGVE
ncbi:uncharacterized protein DUF2490 [Gelidibacter sediminis]|uniref:Uncharacterized protein DUF2490 n=1 Tax=Gelidibacter sediminis TaxID=1608710 RepID=A0A4R7Q0W3_9FLAO|nr:DUF2490 domain-containing protein [Gelidibacter sediminis]TDU40070.1 uncharacterized protein DUF2490 [Gelidibacter sediminis]